MGVPRGVGLCLSIARSRCVRSPPTLGMLPPSAHVEGGLEGLTRGSAARASEWPSGMSYCSRHSAKRRRIPGAAELDSPSVAWSEARMRTSLSVSKLLRSARASERQNCKSTAAAPRRARLREHQFLLRVLRTPEENPRRPVTFGAPIDALGLCSRGAWIGRATSSCFINFVLLYLHRLHDSSCSASRLAVRRIALLFRSVDRTRRVRRNALYSALRTRLASLVQLLLTLL